MNLINILALSIYKLVDFEINLNFIGKYVEWLIKICGNVGLGVILFTLTLKLIVLPFDIYSKVKMKQNAVKMERMRPELEKLQKQYANDKNLYNQKMMALQKKNGYSAFSGCLPLILSLIIFIVAINAFRSYSAYAMLNEYNSIVEYYNTYAVEYTVEGEDKDLFVKNGDVISVDKVKLFEKIDQKVPAYLAVKEILVKDGDSLTLKLDENKKFTASSTEIIDKLLKDNVVKEINYIKGDDGRYEFYYELDESVEEGSVSPEKDDALLIMEAVTKEYLNTVISPKINEGVKSSYEKAMDEGDTSSSFLWVKNVWMSDVSYENPIPASGELLSSKLSAAATKSCSCDQVKIPISDDYDVITAGLQDYKNSPNGYYILIVLSIAVQFASQFIMQKMQKSQMELQSVDGQAAMTQKMMLWMMPIMFGFFAFSYSAAFSIYMTVSSIVSTLSSVLINILVEKKYDKPVEVNEGRSKKTVNKIKKERTQAEIKAKKEAEEKANKKKNKDKNN